LGSEGERRARLRVVGTRSVSRRGGSLQVTIPKAVAEFLRIRSGDKVAFIIDEKSNCVIIGKASALSVTLSGLGRRAVLEFAGPERETRERLG